MQLPTLAPGKRFTLPRPLGSADALLHRHIPGCQGQPHERFWGGHFVQEDRGDYLAEKIIAWAG